METRRFASFFVIVICILLLLASGCSSLVSGQSQNLQISPSTAMTTTASNTLTMISPSDTTVSITDVVHPPDPAKLGTVKKDITYATIDGVAIKMDIYYPESADKAVPVVLYVHGGSWTGGDKDSTGNVYIPDLISSGYMVASINYRLAPAYPIQFQIEDVKCAVRFLKAHASEYGIDKAHIGVMGYSAGAHLAALLGTSDESAGLEGSGGFNDRSSRVQAVIDIAGPADLVTFFLYYPMGKDLFGANVLFSDIERKLSPVTYISSDDPPFLIIHGDKDEDVPLSQSEVFYQKLVDAKVPATLVVVKNADHYFNPVGGNMSPSQDEINRMVIDFFDRYLK